LILSRDRVPLGRAVREAHGQDQGARPTCTTPTTVNIGLEDFGRPGNYMGRQVERWTKQYKASETIHIPEMEKLIEWLPKTLPEQEKTSIVHGDYRLDNMIFHPTEPG